MYAVCWTFLVWYVLLCASYALFTGRRSSLTLEALKGTTAIYLSSVPQLCDTLLVTPAGCRAIQVKCHVESSFSRLPQSPKGK